MPFQDTFQDYRPDPEFEIASHLSTAVTKSTEDFAIPRSARKAENVLEGYHERFCIKELEPVNDQIPVAMPYSVDGWKTLSVTTKREYILGLPWQQLVAVAQAFLRPPTPPPNFSNLVEHVAVRPYIEALLRRCPDYFAIKDYFHDGKVIRVQDVNGTVSVDPKEDDLKAVMGGFVAFRNFYVNGMLKALRADGPRKLNFTHKMVGSIELNSDYDATVGGVDDVAAACEFHRAFRAAWKVESAQLFDTNLYYRDWMTVKDQNLLPSIGSGTDPSVQVQVLDFIGDIYGLVKIRRYTKPEEWCALLEATKRGVTVPGLENPFHPADRTRAINLQTHPSAESEIPRFRRFTVVDKIFKTQFVAPLLARTQDLQAALAGSKNAPGGGTPEELLEHLFEFDKNGMLRTMAIAYIELGAKLRDDETAIKRKFQGAGAFKWRQNNDKGEVADKEVNWGLQGMIEFQERASQLLSEAVLFANEAYNTQGSLWTVVGGQGGNAPENMSVEHFLQSFNEQIGDALKELQEHLHQVHEKDTEVSRLRANLAQKNSQLDAAWQEVVAAVTPGAQRTAALGKFQAATTGLEEASKEITAKEATLTAAANERNVAGFYRASKYEGRMREMLQRIVDDLNKDPAVRKRIEMSRKLFPDPKFHWDSRDLMLLTKESLMAGFYDKYVKQLLLLRKGKDAYSDYSSKKLNEALRNPEEFSADDETAPHVLERRLRDLRNVIDEEIHGAKRPVPEKPPTEADIVKRREWEMLAVKSADLTPEEKLKAALTADEKLACALTAGEKEVVAAALAAWEAEMKDLEDPTMDELVLKLLLKQLNIAVKVEVNKDNLTEKTRELMTTALSDPNFKLFKDNAERKVAEIIYGAGAAGFQTELTAQPGSAPWGMRHLIQHLLWHCALVNQLFRKIRSRGPMDLPVGSFQDAD